MAKKIVKPFSIMGVAAPIALVAGLSLGAQAFAGPEMEYEKTSGGEPWKTSYGECWKQQGTFNPMEECGDKMAEPVAEGPCPDEDGDGVCDADDRCPGTPAGARVDANGCEIIESMVINLDVDEFDFDRATLKPAMKDALDDVAQKILDTQGDESITLVGHTDSIGAEAYNMGLGQRRADAVKKYLAGKGVNADRMSTTSMGETQPIATNKTAEGRAQNRRVELRAE